MARCSIRTMMKVVAGTAVCLAIVVPVARWIATARNLGLQAQCESNMRNVALGIMGVLTTKGSFPSGTIFNANLLPKDRISFYASAIPYLDHGGLYELIDQSQSWAGPTNIAVAGTRDYLLQCPVFSRIAEPAPQPTTTIGIAGLGTDAPTLPTSDPRAGIFGYDRQTTLADIKDGAANKMMLAESGRPIGSWLQGGGATVRGLGPAKKPYIGLGRQFGGLHEGVTIVATADGSVRVVSESIDPKVFEALSTIAGGQQVPAGWDLNSK
jgi:hypothetical protein